MPDRQPQIRVTAMPTDLNPYGGVFGGWLMSQMALGAGSLASRHGKGKAVVVSATDFTLRSHRHCAIAATANFDHRAIDGAAQMQAFQQLDENPMGLVV